MRFDHVGILVRDLDAACTFAREVLGLGEPTEVRVDEYGLSAATACASRARSRRTR